MFSNYLKIAWRNLFRNKAYSAINIGGLAIGMTVALLIGLWVNSELNANKNFPHYDRIVRVMQNSTHGSHTETLSDLPIPLGLELQKKYSDDFKTVVLCSWPGDHILKYGDLRLNRLGRFAQPELKDMLSMHMISGGDNPLSDPSSIILNQTLAKEIFGSADPMGKVLKIDDGLVAKVTGVFEDFPSNCEFRDQQYFMPWDLFVSSQPWIRDAEKQWNTNVFFAFARLRDHADLDKVAARVKTLLNVPQRTDKPEVLLQPMSRWHLYNDFKEGKNVGGTIQFVKMFSLIGFFVLLLACINFMNLSTARSERRAKEVGIRKSVGSVRRQLIVQFLGESLLVTLLAALLSLALLRLALPAFDRVAGKGIGIPWGDPSFYYAIIGFTLITGILAGCYPALYLSSFNPVKVLKGSFKAGRMASLPRKILVVLQFTVSVSLIVGTLVVYAQIQYARNRPAGYDRQGLITVFMSSGDLFRHYEAIRHELLNGGGASEVALSSSPTTSLYTRQSVFDWEGKDPNFVPSFGVSAVTYDFGKTVGWQFREGRDFSRDFATDSSGIVLNEAAVKYMGLKDPVGSVIQYLYTSHRDKRFRVIGVIHDMIMESPFAPVRPTIFTMDSAALSFNVMTIKLDPGMSTARALAQVGPVFKRYNPDAPFNYDFNDDSYAVKFALEEHIGSLTALFTVLAVFISCLGLFGLASFMAEQRTKEIGVRKILGASVMQLWGLLSKEFLLLVSLSFFIALPLAYYVMHGWLQQYDYRTTISVWVFVGTMAGALGITLLTVSFQSIRASMANPVRSLRTE